MTHCWNRGLPKRGKVRPFQLTLIAPRAPEALSNQFRPETPLSLAPNAGHLRP